MIHHGCALDVLKTMDANSVDAIVTDPPAGIGFMGKSWDHHKGGRDQWIVWLEEIMRECLRVLKPGGHAFVWSIPRTSHWTATAVENAGFEIRDVVMHLFGTGFPKSLDVSKAIDKAAGAERETGPIDPARAGRLVNQRGAYATEAGWSAGNRSVTSDPPATDSAKQWEGWGTALKPAAENWILARKPLGESTVAANVLKYGTGALNIDDCRIEVSPGDSNHRKPSLAYTGHGALVDGESNGRPVENLNSAGRWPANVLFDDEAAVMLDEQVGHLVGAGNTRTRVPGESKESASIFGNKGGAPTCLYDRGGGASRFFMRFAYVPKAPRSERLNIDGVGHPTQKPVQLMRYLCRLITPPGGLVLDPFAGSGTTGVAAKAEGFSFIGIEREAEYVAIANARLA